MLIPIMTKEGHMIIEMIDVIMIGRRQGEITITIKIGKDTTDKESTIGTLEKEIIEQ